MKSLRSIFLFICLAGFIGSATLSVQAFFVKKDKKAATEFAIFALACAAAPAVGKATLSMGFFSSPGLEVLKRQVGNLNPKTREDIAQGKNWARDYTLYVRRQITGRDGVYRLIEANNSKELGITNIDKDRLPEGEDIGIEAIAIRQGSHATETDPKAIANYTAVMSSFECELRNAEIVIMQDTKEILRLPVSSILSGATNTIGSNKDTAYRLGDNAFVLFANKAFQINLEFPEAVATTSASASKFHVEIELYGKQLSSK